MKIDIFSHIVPNKYKEALIKKSKLNISDIVGSVEHSLALSDIDVRLRLLDRYPEVLEVLVPALAPLEVFVSPADAPDLAKLYNDEVAELVEKYPDKFLAAVALLPQNDIDAAQKETERAITKLGIRGVLMHSSINGETLDLPKFRPLYEQMAVFDLPIWIHPSYLPVIQTPPLIIQTPSARGISKVYHDKVYQDSFKRMVLEAIQWPVDTSLAMIRLAKSGIFNEYPKIKFITHHCGGLVPFFADRMQTPNIDDMHKFYSDTALLSTVGPLMCGYSFFGPDHLVFGTDMPYGRSHALGITWEMILAVEQLDIPAIDKEKIFERNALRLLRVGV